MRALSELAVAVVGSVNLDLVARAAHLPRAGETVTGARLARHPGGKGANQALAARRLGARVAMIGCVGDDAEAGLALALLRADGVDVRGCVAEPDHATGIAFIIVDDAGENQIVVALGANDAVSGDGAEVAEADLLLCQLEIPVAAVARAVAAARGFVCLNLAPAQAALLAAMLARADLIVVNEAEADAMRWALADHAGLIATTLGARGAVLTRGGVEIARARAPAVDAVDTTGAGDAFTAALALLLAAGRSPDAALTSACAAGALAATSPGAQPAMPWAGAIEALLGRAL